MKIKVRPSTLSGAITVQGSKHAAMACIPCAVATRSVLPHNIPDIIDVRGLHQLLKDNGAARTGNYYDFSFVDSLSASNTIRHSLLLLGLGCFLRIPVTINLPSLGGCKIGHRPIDIHLHALHALGADIKEEDGIITYTPSTLTGTTIKFPYPSFSATINVMLAACAAEGITTIENAAVNPEIYDAVLLLQNRGIHVKYEGGNTLIIDSGCLPIPEYHFSEISGDRIVAFTYACAAAATKSIIEINNVRPHHISAEIETLRKCGVGIRTYDNHIIVDGRHTDRTIGVKTSAYPAFHTDNLPAYCALASVLPVSGIGTILTETIHDNRFAYTQELCKMGANIDVITNGYRCPNGNMGKSAFVLHRDKPLKGCDVEAKDIRGGTALVVAGLAAEGETVIHNAEVIGRGFEDIVRDLKELGADIEWEEG